MITFFVKISCVGTHEPCVPTRSLLSRLVGGFKRSITLFARDKKLEFDWQSRYYDHIIRNVKDRNEIAKAQIILARQQTIAEELYLEIEEEK